MRLKSLEMQGFKSFPDKIKLNFEDGITAVVGPNGSGKSNISDAVRWVLGEQSAKTLRGGKMEDVIFNGTKNRRQQSFAEVSLTIDNSKRNINFDSDDITVTRKYYRSGDSEYRINGNTVRLKDIHEIFMDTGLGRDGYSLIGQGKISEIVAAKSNERREIFEEASGISKYRYRKEEAEKKLNAAEENLLRLNDILKELEERIGPLKEQSEKAKKYIDFAAERKTLEISVWVYQLDRIKEELRDHENRILEVKADYDSISGELESIDRLVESVYESSRKIAVEIDDLRNEISALEEKSALTQSQRAVLENDIEHANIDLQRIEESMKNAGAESSVLLSEIEKENAKKASLIEKRASLEEEMKRGDEELSALEKRGGDSQREEDELSLGLSKASLELSDKAVAVASSESAIRNLSERLNEILESLSVQNENLNQVKEEKKNCDELLLTLKEKNDEYENAKAGVVSLYEMKKGKLEGINEEKQRLLNQAAEKESKANILKDLEKNMEGFGFSVKAVTRRASEGGLRGIFGPISKIIGVPAEYTVAIETALGGAIQNVVVADEDAAKAAIAFLKKTSGGRATFDPITTTQPHSLNAPGIEGIEGFIGTADSLVKYDSKYERVIKHRLGGVAVTEDIDAASYIAKKYGYKFKIVTLDGQVVNAGGSFTGGSVSKSSGILSRGVEIEKLLKNAEELKRKAASFDPEIASLEEEASSLSAKLLAIESEQKTFSEDAIRFEAENKRLTLQIEALENSTNSLTSEKEKTEKAIELHNFNVAECKKVIAAIEEKKASDEKRLSEISEEKGGLTAEREKLTAAVVEKKMAVLEVTKDIEQSENYILRLEGQRSMQNENMGDYEAEKGRIVADIESKKQIIAEIDKDKESSIKLVAEKKQLIEDLANKRNEEEKRVTEIRANEKERLQKREELSIEIARMEERKNSKQTEFDNIISKLWNEYEMTRSEAAAEANELESITAANKRLSELKNKIRALGSVNVDSIEEYAAVSERYEFLSVQLADVEKSKAELSKLINELTRDMSRIFLENFDKINKNFGKIFTELFGGGSASLELSDREDVLNCGIDIIAAPPGKIIKNLSSLSGGEQSLVAIAIYFAIMLVKPSPFCILDEIEAALDDVNVTRYAQYLRRICKNTQFIAITHRRGTMEEADVLYGVTMQEEGVSKLLELRVSEIEKKLGMKQE